MTKQEDLELTKQHRLNLLKSPTAKLYSWYDYTMKDLDAKIRRLEREIKKAN